MLIIAVLQTARWWSAVGLAVFVLAGVQSVQSAGEQSLQTYWIILYRYIRSIFSQY